MELPSATFLLQPALYVYSAGVVGSLPFRVADAVLHSKPTRKVEEMSGLIRRMYRFLSHSTAASGSHQGNPGEARP